MAMVRDLSDIVDCEKGKVFSDGSIQMPCGKTERGHKRVTIVTNEERERNQGTDKDNHGQQFYIHSLVAWAFLPEPQFKKPKVRHINGRKWDNRVENLEYVTHRSVMKRLHATGSITPSNQKRVRLYMFEEDTGAYTFLKEYDNITRAADDNGCSSAAVSKNCDRNKDDLPHARKYAKLPFFELHAFRRSANDDLA